MVILDYSSTIVYILTLTVSRFDLVIGPIVVHQFFDWLINWINLNVCQLLTDMSTKLLKILWCFYCSLYLGFQHFPSRMYVQNCPHAKIDHGVWSLVDVRASDGEVAHFRLDTCCNLR